MQLPTPTQSPLRPHFSIRARPSGSSKVSFARLIQQPPSPMACAAFSRLPSTNEASCTPLGLPPSANTTTTVGAPKKGSNSCLPQTRAFTRLMTAMSSAFCTATISGDCVPLAVGAYLPALSTASSSASVICWGLNLRMLLRVSRFSIASMCLPPIHKYIHIFS